MKKVMFYAALMLTQYSAFADSSEVFPLPGITIGMPSKELMEKYPPEQYDFHKKVYEKIPENGYLAYAIQTNKFWDSLGIQIENSKVKSLCYLNLNRESLLRNPDTHDFDSAVNNVKPLFNQLRHQLGTTFEKKIAYHPPQPDGTRCATYVWKRENDVVAFSHSPVSRYQKGGFFICQVTIAPTHESLNGLYQLATDSVPEDAALWADTMGEEKTGSWLFLIIGVSAAIGTAAAWCCFRKRKSA